MYQLINRHSDAVIDALGDIDVESYIRLREDMRSGKVSVISDTDFQRRYRSYWQMNVARLGGLFYTEYFQLLARCQQFSTVDVGAIANALAGVDDGRPRSMQFSFATKLAHMIDARIPVYDSFVAAFFFYDRPSSERPFSERLEELLRFHAFLRREYERVIRERLLDDALHQFRDRYSICTAVCEQRIVDWLLWGWVSLLRGKARRGESIFE